MKVCLPLQPSVDADDVINTDSSCDGQAGMSLIPKKPEAENTETESTSSVEMPRKTMSISIEIEDAAAKERRQLDEMEFKLLCFDLRVLPPYLQFLSCCGGVFFFFLLYGYFQVRFSG